MLASGSVSLLPTGESSSFTTFIPTSESYRSPPLSPDVQRRTTCPSIHLPLPTKSNSEPVLHGMASSAGGKKDGTVKRDVHKLSLSPVKTEGIHHHHSPSPSTATASGIAAMSLSFIINDDTENFPENQHHHHEFYQHDEKIVRLGSIVDPSKSKRTPPTATTVSGNHDVNAILNAVCAKPDCYRTIRGPIGSFCKYHKQSRFCRAEGCGKSAKTGGYCISHGGGKRCSYPECTKSAKQGGLCISHGGGKRCSEDGCTKSALVGGFCSAHGGGRKCRTSECTKTALLGGYCIAHGGGKRCQVEGCSKSAVGGMLCVSHGGGKRCQTDGCNKGAVRNGVCIRHGAKRDTPSKTCESPQTLRGFKIEFSP